MSLNIVSQPGTESNGIEFYKDEGGKSNWMSVKLILNKPNKKYSHQQTELRAHLYFESGLPVEASDQKILLVRFNGHTTSTLVQEQEDDAMPKRKILINTKDLFKNNGGMTVEFRIQKVSRRKDNQRFTVQLSTSDESIPPIYTRPITVLSKRKIPARLRNDPEAIVRYKAEKMSRAQSNRAAGKRSRRSSEATPELRPLTVANNTFNKGSSKKRARAGGVTSPSSTFSSKDVHLTNKINQMSHTINQLYDMMQDQRIQINALQEQVRMLIDSNMGLGFAVLDGAFEDGTNGSTIVNNNNNNAGSSSNGESLSNVSMIASTMMATNTMLTGLDILSNSSDDISTTFDDSTEKAMAQNVQKETALQWNFNPSSPQVSMPPLPVLNL